MKAVTPTASAEYGFNLFADDQEIRGEAENLAITVSHIAEVV